MSYFFSIIIPVYNTEAYLPRALDSILKQTFDISKIEVIVVNDASPKSIQCDEIIEKYSSKIAIKYIKNELNRGTHLTKKIGIGVSTGQYFLVLDSDDFYENNALNILHEDILKNGSADYIEFNFYELERKSKHQASFFDNSEENKTLEDILSFRKNHTIWNKCFNSSIKNNWQNMEAFYSIFSEDYYEMGIIEHYVKKRRLVSSPLYVYVQATGITSVKKYEKEKLIKIIRSVFNVETQLSSFYRNKSLESCIPLIAEYCESLYRDIAIHSNIWEFIEIANKTLASKTIENTLAKSILKLEERNKVLENRMKMFFPIKIITKPFITLFRRFKRR
jgi:beta-1,4-galactosyltransferase, putative